MQARERSHCDVSGFDEQLGQMIDSAEEAVEVVGRDGEHA